MSKYLKHGIHAILHFFAYLKKVRWLAAVFSFPPLAKLTNSSQKTASFHAIELQLQQQHEQIALLTKQVSSLDEENARLNELLHVQRDKLFGKSSETSKALELTSSTPPPQSADSSPTAGQVITVSTHTRTLTKRGKRTVDMSHLPRYRVIHDLPEQERRCPCCAKALHCIGQDKSEQLEIIPVQYCVIEQIRLKYGCRFCDKVVMAPKPAAPIPKAIAGPSLLTDVILNRYQYHLPFYRQSKLMQSQGILINDNTLANWAFAAGEALLKVYEAMWGILKTRYLQVDETPVKVLQTNKKGYVWAYFSPNMGKGLVAFDFTLTREGHHATQRLTAFKGLLQTDGYVGYNTLRKREDIVAFGCLSHARRKFAEVIKISNDKQGIAAEMIERLKPLYELEARLRQRKGIHHRTRKHLRRRIARPLLQDLYAWLHSVKPKVLPKSALGKAIAYTLKQWPYLMAYVNHGMVEIDTNIVENKIRGIALGRRNWLAIGNEACGKIHALWYTLIISAIINELNPRVYIHYLLTKVHDLRRNTIDPVTLLPDRINSNELAHLANTQIEFAKQVFNMDSS